jgi:hypothetical protein
VLLECVRSSQLGMPELVDAQNFMQALVHLVTIGVQVSRAALRVLCVYVCVCLYTCA